MQIDCMGKTLDEVLSEIDNNNSIQDLLKIISTQLDNRNYFAMFEIPRLRQSKLDSDILVASVKKLHGDLVLVIDKNIICSPTPPLKVFLVG